MEPGKVQASVHQKTGILIISNPPANALSPEVRDEFLVKLNEMSRNDRIHTLIITGAGEKFFAAGADIPGLLNLDRESGLERARKGREFYSGIAHFEKPIIAAINGVCFGGGLELALACDIRIAAEHAKMGLPEVNLGLIPGGGGTQRLPRIVGPGWANYLLFTGETISASKALEIGLVQEVVESGSLRKAAIEIAHKINSKAPLAVKAAKSATMKGLQETLERGLDIENEAFAKLCATHDKDEGITAFLEKRKPQFNGK